MRRTFLPNAFRSGGALVILGGVFLAAVIAARPAPPQTSELFLQFSSAGCVILLGVLLVGIGELFVRTSFIRSMADQLESVTAIVSRLQSDFIDSRRKIDDMAVATERIARSRPTLLDAGLSPPEETVGSQITRALSPALEMLTEIRDVSLLTETERQQRLANIEEERKVVLIRDAIDHIEQQRWAQADHALFTLEAEHRDDDQVKRTRHYFQTAQKNVERDTIENTRQQVEALCSISSFDQAIDAAKRLRNDFPHSTLAQSLLARVGRERDTFNEMTIGRIIDELRYDVDHRMWRRALMHLHTLMEKFPDHPKVQRVSGQMATIRDNAEIEERQELEVRIQELIRSRNFSEAIHLSEELLQRFPLSPQAEAIEQLLPRIRDLQEDQTDVPAMG